MAKLSSILNSQPNFTSDFAGVQEHANIGKDSIDDAYSLAAAVLLGALLHSKSISYRDSAKFIARFVRSYAPCSNEDQFIQSLNDSVQLALQAPDLSDAFRKKLAQAGKSLYADSSLLNFLSHYSVTAEDVKNALSPESPSVKKKLLTEEINSIVGAVHVEFRSSSLSRLVSEFLFAGTKWISILITSWNLKRWLDHRLVPDRVWSIFSVKTSTHPDYHPDSASLIRDFSQSIPAMSSSSSAKPKGPSLPLLRLGTNEVAKAVANQAALNVSYSMLLSNYATNFNSLVGDKDSILASQLAGRASTEDIAGMIKSLKSKARSLKLSAAAVLELDRKLKVTELVRTINAISLSSKASPIIGSRIGAADFDQHVLDQMMANEENLDALKTSVISNAPAHRPSRVVKAKLDIEAASAPGATSMTSLREREDD